MANGFVRLVHFALVINERCVSGWMAKGKNFTEMN